MLYYDLTTKNVALGWLWPCFLNAGIGFFFFFFFFLFFFLFLISIGPIATL